MRKRCQKIEDDDRKDRRLSIPSEIFARLRWSIESFSCTQRSVRSKLTGEARSPRTALMQTRQNDAFILSVINNPDTNSFLGEVSSLEC